MRLRLLITFSVLTLVGCQAARIFQTKVPPPVIKSPDAIESERQAADLIARWIETPKVLKPVALSLSASLGVPDRPISNINASQLPEVAAKVDTDLQDGIRDIQRQMKDLNLRLSKLQGKSIEGTGVSLLGPSTVAIVAFIVVLGVVFPPAFTFILFAYRRLRATASMVVDQIDQAAKAPETAAAIKSIKSTLNGVMDTSHKKVIHSLQKP